MEKPQVGYSPLTALCNAAIFNISLLNLSYFEVFQLNSDYPLLVSLLNLSYCLQWRANLASVILVGSPAILRMKDSIHSTTG